MLNWRLSLPSLRRCRSDKSDRDPKEESLPNVFQGGPPKPRQCFQIIALDEQVSGVRIADRFGFQIHADDANGKTVLRNRLRGAEVFPRCPRLMASSSLRAATAQGAPGHRTQLRRCDGATVHGATGAAGCCERDNLMVMTS